MLTTIGPTDTKMLQEGPKIKSPLPMGLPKWNWGHPMEPRGGQRRPQRKPKDVLGRPRSKESQDAPRERQGGPKGGLRGATWPLRWIKKAQIWAQQMNRFRKRVPRCKKRNVDFSLSFSTTMSSWRVWLGSFWAHAEIMWCHCGHLGRTWNTWRAILDDWGSLENIK